MNSPVLHEAILTTSAEFDADHFRESIAQRCANILHGCHLHKMKMDYKISPVLTGVRLIEMEGLKSFQTHVREKLAELLNLKPRLVEVTVTSIRLKGKEEGLEDGANREEYLHLSATVKRK